MIEVVGYVAVALSVACFVVWVISIFRQLAHPKPVADAAAQIANRVPATPPSLSDITAAINALAGLIAALVRAPAGVIGLLASIAFLVIALIAAGR